MQKKWTSWAGTSLLRVHLYNHGDMPGASVPRSDAVELDMVGSYGGDKVRIRGIEEGRGGFWG